MTPLEGERRGTRRFIVISIKLGIHAKNKQNIKLVGLCSFQKILHDPVWLVPMIIIMDDGREIDRKQCHRIFETNSRSTGAGGNSGGGRSSLPPSASSAEEPPAATAAYQCQREAATLRISSANALRHLSTAAYSAVPSS